MNNYYPKFEYKGMKLLELKITRTRHPKSVVEGETAEGWMERVDPVLDHGEAENKLTQLCLSNLFIYTLCFAGKHTHQRIKPFNVLMLLRTSILIHVKLFY